MKLSDEMSGSRILSRDSRLFYNGTMGETVVPIHCSFNSNFMSLLSNFLMFWLLQFLPSDAMHSADCSVARCLSVCLSVCLSHAGILSKRLNASSIYSPSTSHTTLVFAVLKLNTVAKFRRRPPNGALNARGTKNRDFDQYLAISQKLYELHSFNGILLGLAHALPNDVISNDLEWPWVAYWNI